MIKDKFLEGDVNIKIIHKLMNHITDVYCEHLNELRITDVPSYIMMTYLTYTRIVFDKENISNDIKKDFRDEQIAFLEYLIKLLKDNKEFDRVKHD